MPEQNSTECERHERRLDAIEDKLGTLAEGQARIEGKLDGMLSQKGIDWTQYGVIGAIILGIISLFK